MARQSITFTVLVFVLVAKGVVKSSCALVVVVGAMKSTAELLQLSIRSIDATLCFSILL